MNMYEIMNNCPLSSPQAFLKQNYIIVIINIVAYFPNSFSAVTSRRSAENISPMPFTGRCLATASVYQLVQHRLLNDVIACGGIAPPFLTSVLDIVELSASHAGLFNP
jgi:hypothetical protein